MNITQVNVGTTANDGTGDNLRAAFVKINSNFTEAASAIVGYQYSTPIAGATVTTNNGVAYLILEPAATLATLTITLPSAPTDGQSLRIASTKAITTLTINGAVGQTIKNTATTVAAGGSIGFLYRSSNASWYKVQ